MRYLNSEIIREHRQRNIYESWETFRPLLEKAYRACDALLLIQYAFVLPENGSTDPDPLTIVQNLGQRWLYESIFSFHASLSLAEQGFYTESMSINRGLIKTLVSIMYFTDKPDEIHRLPGPLKKVSKPVTLRERFDYVVPGYYDPHYKFASDLTHPSRGSFVFKLRPTEDGNLVPDLGISFNEEHFGMCLNEMMMLVAGFLRAYPLRFKPLLKWRKPEHVDLVQEATGEVLTHMYRHMELKGEENTWHRTTRPLWDWS